MPDIVGVRPANALAGKAKRVVGIFVLMVGGGIILDSAALWTGMTLMLIAAAIFLWGVAEARPRAVVAIHEHESHSTAAATRSTGSNL